MQSRRCRGSSYLKWKSGTRKGAGRIEQVRLGGLAPNQLLDIGKYLGANQFFYKCDLGRYQSNSLLRKKCASQGR